MPLPITTGGIIPREPPPFMSRPRMPGGARRLPPGGGRPQLEALDSRFQPAPLPTEAPSLADLQGRAQARQALDAAYGDSGGYDPKLAQLEEGSKDAALAELNREQMLSAPATDPKTRPPLTWRDVMAQEDQGRLREQLLAQLRSVGADDEEQSKQRLQELMDSPEYQEMDDETRIMETRRVRSDLRRLNRDEEERILKAASLAAGKGLPSTAFQSR